MDHLTEGSFEFLGESSLSYVTTLISLMTIAIVIDLFNLPSDQ